MISIIEDLPDSFNSLVTEEGSNFSVGQKQLLCVARAMLRKSKLLILDELTANVDRTTDSLLQKTIAKSFAGSTVIAVAHRLETVIDYDRILVLGGGSRLEYDVPWELLSNNDSHFTKMVDDTGENASKELMHKAYEAYMKMNP